MGERLSFGSGGESWLSPREVGELSDVETEKHHDAILRLLARLIEGGGELDVDGRAALRGKIASHLAALGLTDISQLGQITRQLFDARVNPRIPEDYPSLEDFANAFQQVIANRITTEQPDAVPSEPKATQIAQHGRTNWDEVTGRGLGLLLYSYGLGVLMSSRLAYTNTFREDTIKVRDDWQIENGRHRALTLRTLGPEYVVRSRMNGWVKAQKER